MPGIVALLLCILTTGLLFTALRATARYDIDRWQVTGINYAVAALVGLAFSPRAIAHVCADTTALVLACAIGGLFIFIFYVMAVLTQEVGVGYMTIVSKVSLAIPVLFSWLHYGDALTGRQAVGVGLALVAVVLVNVPSDAGQGAPEGKGGLRRYLLAAVLFAGCGVGDSLFKVFSQTAAARVAAADFTIAVFAVGALGAALVNALLLLTGRTRWRPASLWAGMAIGIPNYFSIVLLAMSLAHFPGTVFYPVFNTSLLLLMAVVGMVAFRERMNRWNLAGLAVTIAAVGLLV